MPTPIQSASTTKTGVTSGSVAFTTSNVSAGNKIVVAIAISSGGSATVSTVKDAAGNSWTLLASKAAAAGGQITYLYALDVPSGDAGTKPTITVTLTGGSADFSVIIQEVPGLLSGNTTAMIDGTTGTSTGNGGSSAVSGAYSSTASGEYLVAIYGDDGGPETFTVPSGYTLDTSSVNSNSNDDIALAYKSSTGGSETASWGLSGTAADWSTLLVAFKVAATSVVTPPVRPRRATELTDAQIASRRRVASTSWPVPVQPPTVPNPVGIRRNSKPLYPRRGVVAPTGWPVTVQPAYVLLYERRWARPLLPRRGVVPSRGLPFVLVQTGYGVFGAVTASRVLPFRRTGRAESVVDTTGSVLTGSVSLSGIGTFSSSVTRGSNTSLSGQGTLTVNGVLAGSASLSGLGSFSVQLTWGFSAPLSGLGVLASSGVFRAVTSLAGFGQLLVSGILYGISTELTGLGGLLASASVGGQYSGLVSLIGSGVLSASGSIGFRSTLDGSGSLGISVTVSAAAQADLSGSGSLSASRQFISGILLVGLGSLSFEYDLCVTLLLTGTGVLTVTGNIGGQHYGNLLLSGSGALSTLILYGYTAYLFGSGQLVVASLASVITMPVSVTVRSIKPNVSVSLSAIPAVTVRIGGPE